MLEERSLGMLIRKNRFAYYMLAPLALGFLVFTVMPQLWIIAMSLMEYQGIGEPEYVGIENFVTLFTREGRLWWYTVGNTLYFAFGKLAIELPLAFFCALILNASLKGRGIFRWLFLLPHITSMAIMSMTFTFIFASYNGLINSLLISAKILNEPFEFFTYHHSAMWVGMSISIWQCFGINMILFLAGLQSIPLELFESADLDGANAFQKFLYITIPAMGRMVQIIVMLALIGSMRIFEIYWVLTRGGPAHATETIMTLIFKKYFGYEFAVQAIGYASALGLAATVIIALITVIYLRLSRGLDRAAS